MIRPSPAMRDVLFVNTGGDLYGAERSLLDVVERMTPAWRPHFVVPGPGRLAHALEQRGLPTDLLPIPVGIGRRWSIALGAALRLARLIRARHVDLVHLNLHFAAPLVALSCLMTGVPLVVHVRNMVDGRFGLLQQILFRQAAAIICISEAVRRSLLDTRLLSTRLAQAVRVIPDARDLSRYERGDRARGRRSLGIGSVGPVLGIVARIEPGKGQDIFLKMAAIVAERLPGARFLLIGELMGDRHQTYMQQLRELQERLDLADRVVFTGYRDDMPDVLAALDCLVLPCRRGAFVSVLIEAMAAGVPIVTSDLDGIPECVGRDGIAELVEPGDPAAFAEAVLGILSDRDRTARMSAGGRDRARRLYDVGALTRQTEEVFASCV